LKWDLIPYRDYTIIFVKKHPGLIEGKISVLHATFSPPPKMLLKTLLNFTTNYKSFRFGKVSFEEKGTPHQHIVAVIHHRKNSRGICPECGRSCPTYDTAQEPRRWEFVPLWNIPVFFAYRQRRVTCPEHGVITEQVPWSEGNHTQTVEQRQFLANWARRMNWSETTRAKLHP
jgi:hypothetical protein